MIWMVVSGLLGTSALIALVSPCIVLCTRTISAADRRSARHYLACSGGLVIALLCMKFELSFSWHPANVVSSFLAILAGGALVRFSLRIKPRWLAALVGSLGMLCWLVVSGLLALSAMFGGSAPITAALGDGWYCSETAHGFLPSDSRRALSLERRTLFVDRTIERIDNHDEFSSEYAAVPASVRAWVSRCETAIDLQRRPPGP